MADGNGPPVPVRVVHGLQPLSAIHMRQIGLGFLAHQIVREDLSRPPMVVILRDATPPVLKRGSSRDLANARTSVLDGNGVAFVAALEWSHAERLGTLVKRAVSEIGTAREALPTFTIEPVPCFFPDRKTHGQIGVTARMMEDDGAQWPAVVLSTREAGATAWTVEAILGATTLTPTGVSPSDAANTAGGLLQRKAAQVRKIAQAAA